MISGDFGRLSKGGRQFPSKREKWSGLLKIGPLPTETGVAGLRLNTGAVIAKSLIIQRSERAGCPKFDWVVVREWVEMEEERVKMKINKKFQIKNKQVGGNLAMYRMTSAPVAGKPGQNQCRG